jgi:hypothetical protein
MKGKKGIGKYVTIQHLQTVIHCGFQELYYGLLGCNTTQFGKKRFWRNLFSPSLG